MSLSLAERSVAPAIKIIYRDEASSTPIPASGELTEPLMDRLETDFSTGITESLPPQTLSAPVERMPITLIEHKVWANAQRTEMKTVWKEEVKPHDAIMATLKGKKDLNKMIKPDHRLRRIVGQIIRGFRAYQTHPIWTR
jgi:hypothetical protein